MHKTAAEIHEISYELNSHSEKPTAPALKEGIKMYVVQRQQYIVVAARLYTETRRKQSECENLWWMGSTQNRVETARGGYNGALCNFSLCYVPLAQLP